MITPARSAAIGTAVMVACACGAGNSSARLLTMYAFPASAKLTHPLFIAVGAAFILFGLARIQRMAAVFAAGAFAILIPAAAMTPPMAMSKTAIPWNATQVAGAFLYLVFAVLMVKAFRLAFPTPRPRAALVGMTGTAVATGCQCCMVTGAIAGLLATAGLPAIVQQYQLVFLTGIAITGIGLYQLSGLRTLPWLASGAVISVWGGKVLAMTGDWTIGQVNLRFIPGYALYLIGAGLIVKAWALALEPYPVEEEQLVADEAHPVMP